MKGLWNSYLHKTPRKIIEYLYMEKVKWIDQDCSDDVQNRQQCLPRQADDDDDNDDE